MENMNPKQTGKEPQKATISLYLAIASLLIIAISYPLNYFLKHIGIVDFLNLAILLAIAAIVLSMIAKSRTDKKTITPRKSTVALILGIVSVVIIILIRVAVFLVFIPMLGK